MGRGQAVDATQRAAQLLIVGRPPAARPKHVGGRHSLARKLACCHFTLIAEASSLQEHANPRLRAPKLSSEMSPSVSDGLSLAQVYFEIIREAARRIGHRALNCSMEEFLGLAEVYLNTAKGVAQHIFHDIKEAVTQEDTKLVFWATLHRLVNSWKVYSARLPPYFMGAKQWVEQNPKRAAILLCSIATFSAPTVIATITLCAAGFGAPGIMAGSLAVYIHRIIGNPVARSLFATLTSAGMGGYGMQVVRIILKVAAAIAIVAILWTSMASFKN
ncbi:hypothetical protein G7046_g7678 [Stylonectria norvegica]|nr:hypothetical protein G7046_g7678 [Stylonectria norvegica]